MPEATLVMAADKLHNVSALVRDVRRDGARTMDRFNAKPAQVIWYHQEVVSGLRGRVECPQNLVTELEIAVATLATLLDLGESGGVGATPPALQ